MAASFSFWCGRARHGPAFGPFRKLLFLLCNRRCGMMCRRRPPESAHILERAGVLEVEKCFQGCSSNFPGPACLDRIWRWWKAVEGEWKHSETFKYLGFALILWLLSLLMLNSEQWNTNVCVYVAGSASSRCRQLNWPCPCVVCTWIYMFVGIIPKKCQQSYGVLPAVGKAALTRGCAEDLELFIKFRGGPWRDFSFIFFNSTIKREKKQNKDLQCQWSES